jgi:hypothetical protein
LSKKQDFYIRFPRVLAGADESKSTDHPPFAGHNRHPAAARAALVGAGASRPHKTATSASRIVTVTKNVDQSIHGNRRFRSWLRLALAINDIFNGKLCQEPRPIFRG